jgi:hypothetical protein
MSGSEAQRTPQSSKGCARPSIPALAALQPGPAVEVAGIDVAGIRGTGAQDGDEQLIVAALIPRRLVRPGGDW